MLTYKRAVNNLTKIAKQASQENWTQGKAWYPAARAFCLVLSNRTGLSVDQIVGILAALSPQCSWEENKRATEELVLSGTIGVTVCYPANVKKAKRILQGEDPALVLGGFKVRAFFNNILYPNTSQDVTVDTHAARAAFNQILFTRSEQNFIFRRKGNEIIQRAYKTVANAYKVTPCTLQAVIWLTVKDVIGTLPRGEQNAVYNK